MVNIPLVQVLTLVRVLFFIQTTWFSTPHTSGQPWQTAETVYVPFVIKLDDPKTYLPIVSLKFVMETLHCEKFIFSSSYSK